MTSPHDWQFGDTFGPANSTKPETAQPDMGEASSAVSESYSARAGNGVIDVPNMSDAGMHKGKS